MKYNNKAVDRRDRQRLTRQPATLPWDSSLERRSVMRNHAAVTADPETQKTPVLVTPHRLLL